MARPLPTCIVLTPSRIAARVRIPRRPRSSFDYRTSQSIRVLVPGQFGNNNYHRRFYTPADPEEQTDDGAEFTLCVRRCHYIDGCSGEQYRGVASNYLCGLRRGDSIEFSGPFGLAFPEPENRTAAVLMIGMGTGIAPFRAFIRKYGGYSGSLQGGVSLSSPGNCVLM